MTSEGSVNVVVQVGGTVERIETLQPVQGEMEETVTIAFRPEEAGTVSLSFGVSAFVAFVARLSRFAHRLSGPS